ncbi:jg5051 [Pararge aegeria aegeria]|uniref:Jg5051 protein n=1 Tax=Pararge aegeria aegeria TaxID=348720 RepID=A0A8S4SK98_9NEOP|nr:jg5051 [Pararge aegeria aegeria]
MVSTDRCPLLVIGLLEGVPNSKVLCRLDPAATCNALNRLSTSLGVDQRCAYQCRAAIPALWDPNCAPPIATSASRLVEPWRYLWFFYGSPHF